MIWLMPKPSRKKNPKIIGVSLWLPSSPDLNPLDYAIWSVLENKTNATSYRNIGSLKTAIEEKWNKMSGEFILKVCKSFRRRVDTTIKKNGSHIELIYCFLSIFFFKLTLILFYNRVVYYYTRIFLILIPHPVRLVSLSCFWSSAFSVL